MIVAEPWVRVVVGISTSSWPSALLTFTDDLVRPTESVTVPVNAEA